MRRSAPGLRVKNDVPGLKRAPKLCYPAPVDAEIPVAGSRCRSDRDDSAGSVQEELKVINKAKYPALERRVEISFISLDNGASGKRRHNVLYFEPVFCEIPLQMKRVDFVPDIRRFRRDAIGAIGTVQKMHCTRILRPRFRASGYHDYHQSRLHAECDRLNHGRNHLPLCLKFHAAGSFRAFRPLLLQDVKQGNLCIPRESSTSQLACVFVHNDSCLYQLYCNTRIKRLE